MGPFWDNFDWMILNVSLALLPLFFINFAFKVENKIIKGLFFLLWFLFFPNTIYLLTDLQYLPGQFSKFNVTFDVVLVGQYLVLALIGIITYIYSLRPLVSALQKKYRRIKKEKWNFIVMIFNFLVSFGVFLGKVQRTESWDIFINPIKVIGQVNNLVHDSNTFVFIFLFGVLINVIYFARETS